MNIYLSMVIGVGLGYRAEQYENWHEATCAVRRVSGVVFLLFLAAMRWGEMRMFDTASVHIALCPTWTGMLPAQGSVPAMEYHVAVEQWQAVLRENKQLRERIAELERELSEKGR